VNNLKGIVSYFLMFPAIFIGTLAMVSYGVPSSIWIQNIIIWILGTVWGSVFIIRNREKNLTNGNSSYTIIIVALLVLPFFFNDLDGIHRWLTFGPINIYIASIICPLLIIHLWKLTLKNREYYVFGLTLIILIILLFHPDAGQLTAFACATVIILWKKISRRIIKLLYITLTVVLVTASWVFLDDLEPVPYVEDIIFLVADLGNVWFIMGILSLILLLSPFFFYGKKSIVSLALGVYFLITMIVTLIGNFPMPIMGYGISPIIGYIISITLLNKNKENLG
jgi:cell division protein FtsW (lipid II flippase)